MSTDSVVIRSPYYWITLSVIYLLFCFTNLLILKSEYHQRNDSSITFTTKWLKIFSMSCIICGFINPVFSLLGFVPYVCVLSEFINILATILEPLFMGYYQLSRLYYCFSNNQIHSNKGYPKCLFIYMYIFGVFLGVNTIPTMLFNDTQVLIISSCGYDDNYNFYFQPTSNMPSLSPFAGLWFLVIIILFVFWDLSTLFLYIWKIRSFLKVSPNHNDSNKKDKNEVIIHKRIMQILYKISILTIFYELVILILMLTFIFVLIALSLGELANLLSSDFLRIYGIFMFKLCLFAINYSMYLMMDHNKDKYFRFLTRIYTLRLNYLCCCCRGMVEKQLAVFDKNMNGMTEVIASDTANKKRNEESQTNISIHDQKIDTNGVELSVKSEINILGTIS